MISIQPTSRSQKCTPNLLPARISHNGPINETERYWKPENDENGKPHAYFRGRHLYGTAISLPENYTGALLHVTDKDLPTTTSSDPDRADLDEDMEDDEEKDTNVAVKAAEKVGEFDEVMIWEHGGVMEKDDAYVRGIEEWIGFAESMHIDEDEGKGKTTG